MDKNLVAGTGTNIAEGVIVAVTAPGIAITSGNAVFQRAASRTASGISRTEIDIRARLRKIAIGSVSLNIPDYIRLPGAVGIDDQFIIPRGDHRLHRPLKRPGPASQKCIGFLGGEVDQGEIVEAFPRLGNIKQEMPFRPKRLGAFRVTGKGGIRGRRRGGYRSAILLRNDLLCDKLGNFFYFVF